LIYHKYGFSTGSDDPASDVTLGDGNSASTVAALTALTVPIQSASGVQTLEVTTAEAATLTVPASATEVLISVDYQSEGALHYWEGGETPTGEAGIEVLPGYAQLATEPLSNHKFIAQTKAVTIQVTYRKYGQ
jgi:hypothetical protein